MVKKSLLTTITAAIVITLTGCGGTTNESADPAKQAFDAVTQYSAENAGACPPNAAELTTYARKKGIVLPYQVVDMKEATWKEFSQKPRPAIGNGALKNLIGYYVNPSNGQFGIATETQSLSNK